MNELDFVRCKALNNVPSKKINDYYLVVRSSCTNCKNKEIAEGMCSTCVKAITNVNKYWESNIPVEYWALKMEEDFKGDKRLFDKYNELNKNIKEVFINGSSICFAGNHGTGKTMTTTALLKSAVVKDYFGLYTTFQEMVSVLTNGSGEDKFTAKRELTMVDFLVIDEVDPRFIASDNMADLYARHLETVVRTRRQNKLPTFICTNSPNVSETFNGSLKQSIESILSGYMETFIVLGTDFRKGKK